MYKVFRYQKLSEKPKRSPTKFVGTVGQKISYESHDTPFAIEIFR